MKLTTNRVQQVEEVDYGVWLWQMPDGSFVSDDEGRQFMMKGNRIDLRAVKKMTEGVRQFGITEGHPHFMSGHRPVTDDEYDEQEQRLNWGLIPDTQDVPAILDARKHAQRFK